MYTEIEELIFVLTGFCSVLLWAFYTLLEIAYGSGGTLQIVGGLILFAYQLYVAKDVKTAQDRVYLRLANIGQ